MRLLAIEALMWPCSQAQESFSDSQIAVFVVPVPHVNVGASVHLQMLPVHDSQGSLSVSSTLKPEADNPLTQKPTKQLEHRTVPLNGCLWQSAGRLGKRGEHRNGLGFRGLS